MSAVVAATPQDAEIKTAMSLDNILSPPTADNASTSPIPDNFKVYKAETPETSCNQHNVSFGEVAATCGDSTAVADSSNHEPDNEKDDHIDREFICMNDEYSKCNTGQYSLKLSRKVISNHFGRNKGCTRKIQNWPLFCRKHYQRATYKPKLWQRRKVNLILRQFDVIEQEHAGTTYTVSLKKSEMDRLNLFARSVDSGMAAPEAGVIVAPNPEIKSFQAPIDTLRELQYELGCGKTIDQVKNIMAIINTMLRDNECDEVPSIEFLPEVPSSKSSKPPKFAKVKTAKAAPVKGSKASKPKASGPGRVSRKGAIRKTRAN
jgi:hypothetical protein